MSTSGLPLMRSMARVGAKMFKIVMVNPLIPQNSGTTGRLALATGCELIFVGKLGFSLEEKYLRRAGLDYWKYVNWRHYRESFSKFYEEHPGRYHFLSTHAVKPYTGIPFQNGDFLVFGNEDGGLGPSILNRFHDNSYRIPMIDHRVRSLNLATSIGIVVYEGRRQITGDNLQTS